jgi:hypothetical protein
MRVIIYFLVSLSLVACKKYLAVPEPHTQLSSSAVFESDATATAAQLSIYSQMETNGILFQLSAYTGLSADEFRNHSSQSDYVDLSTNNLTAGNDMINSIWTNLYKYIYQCNAVLEGIARSSTLTPAIKDQIEGEARFIRALCHYYLVSLYGPVPIVSTTDYRVNAIIARSPVPDVYSFILQDLSVAKNLLPVNYKSGSNTITTDRVRPNKWSAGALLARIYLQQGNWAAAETEADSVINASMYGLTADLNNSFLKGSTEAIFQLMAVVPKFNTYAGANFILSAAPSILSIAPGFLSSFRPGDKRQISWTKSISTSTGVFYFPYKYKVGQNASSVTEYTIVLRLAEQYLIRAEARAKQGKIPEGLTDLNVIRVRAGLPVVTGLNQQALSDSIQVERKFELMFETGDRWINLQRTGTGTSVLSPIKGSNWSESDLLYPIPQTDRLRNPNLSQNAGY